MIENNLTPNDEVLKTEAKVEETKPEVKAIRTRTTAVKKTVSAAPTRSRTRTSRPAVSNEVQPEAIVAKSTPSITETVETMKDSDKEKAKKAKAKEKEKKEKAKKKEKEKREKQKAKDKEKKKKAKAKEKAKKAKAKKKVKAKKKSKSKKKK